MPTTAVPDLDLADVQGLVVRGYTMPFARHLLLRIDDPVAARRLLGSLVDGSAAGLQVTSGVPWDVKPDCCLNLAVTAAGLRALQVPPASLASAELAQFFVRLHQPARAIPMYDAVIAAHVTAHFSWPKLAQASARPSATLHPPASGQRKTKAPSGSARSPATCSARSTVSSSA